MRSDDRRLSEPNYNVPVTLSVVEAKIDLIAPPTFAVIQLAFSQVIAKIFFLAETSAHAIPSRVLGLLAISRHTCYLRCRAKTVGGCRGRIWTRWSGIRRCGFAVLEAIRWRPCWCQAGCCVRLAEWSYRVCGCRLPSDTGECLGVELTEFAARLHDVG